MRAFAQANWLGMIIPNHGGSGLGVRKRLMLHEVCAAGAGTTGASPIRFTFPRCR
jgi:hypothetical protein